MGDMVGLARVEDAELRRELGGEFTGEPRDEVEMAETEGWGPPVRTDIETGRDVEGVREARRATIVEGVEVEVVRTGRVGGEWTGEPRGEVGEEEVATTTAMEAGALWSTLALMWEKFCLKDWIFFSEGLGL